MSEQPKLSLQSLQENKLFSVANSIDDLQYDKKLLLEIANLGYDPLNQKDVQNYFSGQPPLNLNRNITLSGARENQNLGMGQYSEMEIQQFSKIHNADIVIKKHENNYLTDYKNKKSVQILMEETEATFDMDKVDVTTAEIPKTDKKTTMEIDNDYRSNLAKVFGSENIKIKNPEVETFEVVKSNSKITQVLELIKEFKALGFSDEEIKKEIQNLR